MGPANPVAGPGQACLLSGAELPGWRLVLEVANAGDVDLQYLYEPSLTRAQVSVISSCRDSPVPSCCPLRRPQRQQLLWLLQPQHTIRGFIMSQKGEIWTRGHTRRTCEDEGRGGKHKDGQQTTRSPQRPQLRQHLARKLLASGTGDGLRGLGAGEAGRFEEESLCGVGPAEEVSSSECGSGQEPLIGAKEPPGTKQNFMMINHTSHLLHSVYGPGRIFCDTFRFLLIYRVTDLSAWEPAPKWKTQAVLTGPSARGVTEVCDEERKRYNRCLIRSRRRTAGTAWPSPSLGVRNKLTRPNPKNGLRDPENSESEIFNKKSVLQNRVSDGQAHPAVSTSNLSASAQVPPPISHRLSNTGSQPSWTSPIDC
nr:uncharacterized protein LOC129473184 [Symphalangus syndactylus]